PPAISPLSLHDALPISDREQRVEEFFLRAATLMPDRRFLLGGSGWDDKPMPPNVEFIGHTYTKDHNAFNCTPLAVLNISRDSMRSEEHTSELQSRENLV